MKPSLRFVALITAVAALPFLSSAGFAEDALPAPKKILFFSKSSGFEHDAIKLKLKDGRPGYAFAVLREIGKQNNIEFTFSKDGSLFTPDYLAQFDAFCFYTTGDLTQSKGATRGDGGLPMSPAGKAAFLQAIAAGKGFIGIHSATDTFHSPGSEEPVTATRFLDDGDRADPYIKMIGAEFIMHGAQQPSHQIVIDPKFPGMAAVPADFGPLEEWYTLKDFAPNLHVLLVQDTAGMKGSYYARPPYPSTWARMYEKGRVFYTNMGHREDVWDSAPFQSVLAGGLNWALGRVEVDVSPNLATAAPGASVLEKYVPPAPKAPKTKAAAAP